MLKTFYIQTEVDTNRIIDTIEYPHDGYLEVQLETPLPPKIIGGAYKLLSGSAVYVPEWDKDKQQDLLDNLILDNLTMQSQIDSLITSSLV